MSIKVTDGRDSSVGITTGYGLGGPGIESWRGEIFHSRPERSCGPTSLRHNGYQVFPGGKAVGAWRFNPPPTSAEVKDIVELYICSYSVLSWPILG